MVLRVVGGYRELFLMWTKGRNRRFSRFPARKPAADCVG